VVASSAVDTSALPGTWTFLAQSNSVGSIRRTPVSKSNSFLYKFVESWCWTGWWSKQSSSTV